MTPLTFRAALRSTAKIVFTAAIAGCGNSSASSPPDSDGAPGRGDATRKDVAASADADLGDRPRDARQPGHDDLRCGAPKPSTLFDDGGPTKAGAGAVSEKTFDCCIAGLAPLLVGDAGAEPADAAAADPEVVACCAVAVFALDQAYTHDGGSFGADAVEAFSTLGPQAAFTCCYALNWPGPTVCAVWGPPSPPAMPGESSGFGPDCEKAPTA